MDQNKQITFWPKTIAIASSFLLLIVAIIINSEFRQSLFLMGMNSVNQIQQSYQMPLITIFINLLSQVCNFTGVSLIFLIIFLGSKRKMRALVFITYFMMVTFIIDLLKQAYQQPRPFWYNSKIQVVEWFSSRTCLLDFGDPSGHSMTAIMLFEPIFTDFIPIKNKKVLVIILIIIQITIPFTRMYLGAHSLNQVVFGSLIGLVGVVFYRYKAQEALYNLFSSIITKKRKSLLFLVIIAALICITLPIIFYSINSSHRPISQTVITNINKICKNTVTSHKVQLINLMSAGKVAVALGIIFGMFLLKNQNDLDNKFMVGKWSYSSKKSNILYHLCMLLLVALPGVVLVVIVPMVVGSATVKYFSFFIGIALMLLGMVGVLSRFEKYFEWIDYSGSQ